MPRGGFRPGAGRPRMAAEDIAVDTWNERVRRVRDALQELDEWDIVKEGICKHVKAMVGRNAKCVVERALESEQASEEMLRKLEAPEVKRLPKDDALMMLLHLKISQHQYEQLAKMMNQFSGTSSLEHMIPCYPVISVHKSTLRPANVTVTEAKAQVPLQDLLQHTVERMVQSNERKILEILSGKQEQQCTLTFCYGFDSCTGQRQYKQRFIERGNGRREDKSLIAGVLNPWALKTDDDKVLWLNKFAQSSSFIRTFYLEYAKETNDFIRRFSGELQQELNNLEDIHVTVGNRINLTVKFRSYFTMIDGKVFNVLSDTSTSQCPSCCSGRDDFNNVENIGTEQFAIEGDGGNHQLQSMHAWIKFLKLLTSLSFRLPAHQAGLTERTQAWRTSIKAHSQVIIARCKQRWGVTIEGPGMAGSGTSLDGNTSRRLFKDPTVLATVLDINPDIVKRFKTILLCINSTQYKLNVDRFQQFAFETYRLYVQEYGWFIMSPSVHKVLIHAAEIQENLDMPMGAASEGGGELLHRLRKEVRLHATRKDSRLHTMEDLINRCLDISDPLISAKAEKMLNKFRVRDPLPDEAMRLLDTGRPDDDEPPRPPTIVPSIQPQALPVSTQRRTLRGRRRLPETQPDVMEQPPNIPSDSEDDDDDDDLRQEDGNETDYEIDLEEDMDTD